MSGSIADLDTEHARLGPSGADGWVPCAAYAEMNAKWDDGKSGFPAELGTAAHELLEECLSQNNHALDHIDEVFNECNEFPEGFRVDLEMAEAVEEALVIARREHERMLKDDPDTEFFAERRVNPGYWLGRVDCWGTADITIVNKDEIMVLDYKHGSGVFVPIKGKKQTILYLLGALAELPSDYLFSPKILTHGVIQPRYPDSTTGDIFRTEFIEACDLHDWIKLFKDAAKASDAPNAVATPGEEQCRWCAGEHHCEAHGKDAVEQMFGKPVPLATVDLEREVMREPGELSPTEIVAVIKNADYLKAFIKSVVDYARDALIAGNAPKEISDRYKMVEALGNAAWVDESNQGSKLKNMGLRHAEIFVDKLKSPTQIRKVVKSLKSEVNAKGDSRAFSKRKLENLEKQIERPARAPKMVPITDSKPGIKTRAEEMFPAQTTTDPMEG